MAVLPLFCSAQAFSADESAPAASVQMQPGMEVPVYAAPQQEQSAPAPAPNFETSQSESQPNTQSDAQPDAPSDQNVYPPLSAADAAQFAGDLSSLENKFYRHDFSSDNIVSRLNRIERLVYGSAMTGSIQDRITKLLLDVPNLPAEADQATTNVQPVASQALNEPAQGQPAFKGPQSSPSLKAEVSAMESQVFGQTYPNENLTNRVVRLEKSVFAGQPVQTFGKITTRINNLMTALQPRFSTPQTIGTDTPVLASSKNANTSEEEKQKHGHPFLKKLGHALEQGAIMAGESMGSMAVGSMMGGYGGYNGYGGYGGLGVGGYGMGGYGPYGYGGFPPTGGMGYSW
ncbi:MAG: hypothetical protein K2X27_24605 [Candidatus Obscuribacterales bacterium]|nr:hypothetical protein [Candidatus Obscuribacterales bacterium]